jgi:hypothetical protein
MPERAGERPLRERLHGKLIHRGRSGDRASDDRGGHRDESIHLANSRMRCGDAGSIKDGEESISSTRLLP